MKAKQSLLGVSERERDCSKTLVPDMGKPMTLRLRLMLHYNQGCYRTNWKHNTPVYTHAHTHTHIHTYVLNPQCAHTQNTHCHPTPHLHMHTHILTCTTTHLHMHHPRTYPLIAHIPSFLSPPFLPPSSIHAHIYRHGLVIHTATSLTTQQTLRPKSAG